MLLLSLFMYLGADAKTPRKVPQPQPSPQPRLAAALDSFLPAAPAARRSPAFGRPASAAAAAAASPQPPDSGAAAAEKAASPAASPATAARPAERPFRDFMAESQTVYVQMPTATKKRSGAGCCKNHICKLACCRSHRFVSSRNP